MTGTSKTSSSGHESSLDAVRPLLYRVGEGGEGGKCRTVGGPTTSEGAIVRAGGYPGADWGGGAVGFAAETRDFSTGVGSRGDLDRDGVIGALFDFERGKCLSRFAPFDGSRPLKMERMAFWYVPTSIILDRVYQLCREGDGEGVGIGVSGAGGIAKVAAILKEKVIVVV